jgi:hypothetical protein
MAVAQQKFLKLTGKTATIAFAVRRTRSDRAVILSD